MEQVIAKLLVNTHKIMYLRKVVHKTTPKPFPDDDNIFKKIVNSITSIAFNILTFGSSNIDIQFIYLDICYEYYVNFKIDEGRYYYVEKKPKLIYNEDEDEYYFDGYETKSIMTKNGIEKSLKILIDIKERTLKIHPNYTTSLTNEYNNEKDMQSVISFFSQFDK